MQEIGVCMIRASARESGGIGLLAALKYLWSFIFICNCFLNTQSTNDKKYEVCDNVLL